jgi:hypothetical protein
MLFQHALKALANDRMVIGEEDSGTRHSGVLRDFGHAARTGMLPRPAWFHPRGAARGNEGYYVGYEDAYQELDSEP